MGEVLCLAPMNREQAMHALLQGDAKTAYPLLAAAAQTDPADEELGIAAGEAAWATQGADAAIPYYSRVLARAPSRMMLRHRLALALLTAGQPEAAIHHLEPALKAAPNSAPALTLMGMALSASGHHSAAVATLRRAVQLDPSDAASAFHMGQALRDLGALDEAVDAFNEAVRRDPRQAHLHLALGDALMAQRDFVRALATLREAAALQPASALAWARLGDAERIAGTPSAAADCYRRALAQQPGDADLQRLLGNALVAAGDQAGATAELGQAMLTVLRGQRDCRLRVGIIAAPGAANTPTDFLIDRASHDVSPVFMLDGFSYPVATIGGFYDVLFNAICDPDAAAGPLALASHLAPQFRLPVLNHPWAVAVTTRDEMARRLSGLPGIHMPLTRRVTRAALEPAHFTGPCLVRGAGQHGGAFTQRAASAAEMMAAARLAPSDDLFLTDFVDVRSPDGFYRKLRIVFVADEPFPVHLAIGEQWLSHYFRTSMDSGMREEEAAFLRQPDSTIGRACWDALHGLPHRVGLDYFGIDAAVGRDGRLVIFECNAAMLVRHTDRPRTLDYKRAAALRVRSAMSRLLRQTVQRVERPLDALEPPLTRS